MGAAMLRADGRPVTARAARRLAWARKRQLLAWAALSTLVGAVTRVLERFGIGGLLAALSLDVGWAFATVFATPVIMVEGTMPVATIRRSTSLLRGRFTVLLMSSIGAGAPFFALAMCLTPVAVVSAMLFLLGSGLLAVVGGVLLVASVVVIAGVLAMSGAVGAYLEANLYRYAVGRPVPGVDRHLLPPPLPS